MSEWKAKRFWKAAAVVELDEGYTVKLDDRPVKTPAKAPLILPTQGLAKAVATEWDAQEDIINPHTMPATRTANSAIDRVVPQKAAVADMLAAYGDSDLLCYRADHPEELVERQRAHWDPLLEWADRTMGARLVPFEGVMHRPQDPQALAKLRAATHDLGAFELAAFHDLVSLSGSLVIGFAVTQGYERPEKLWEISRLDETWQAEQWGHDEEAEAMAAIKRESFLHGARMFTLCRPKS